MVIRFLHTTPSDNPHMPFVAGQTITIGFSPRVQEWIEKDLAVVLDDDTERADMGEPVEKAVMRRPKARGPR